VDVELMVCDLLEAVRPGLCCVCGGGVGGE
jgi:hypothetical protein